MYDPFPCVPGLQPILTAHAQVLEAEVEGIRESFRDPAYAREHVLRIGEQQFNCVRADESAIYAKNASWERWGLGVEIPLTRAAQGKAGVIIGQTSQFFVLATYSPTMFASICAEAAESLGEGRSDIC